MVVLEYASVYHIPKYYFRPLRCLGVNLKKSGCQLFLCICIGLGSNVQRAYKESRPSPLPIAAYAHVLSASQ